MRALVLVLVLALATFAGCITGDDEPVNVPPAPDEPLFAGQPFPVGASRHLPSDSFEPTLGILEDGTIFMSTFDGSTAARELVSRSTDQGLTWQDVTAQLGPVSFPPNSNDPYVYVDRDTDRVFYSDLQALICSTLAWSDDAGDSWITNPIGCGHPFGVHDHQSVFTSRPRALETVGYPNIVHYCVNRVVDSACAFSLDGGLTFGPLRALTYTGLQVPSGDLCGGLHAHGAGDPDGRVYLPRGYCGVPSVAVSEDDGLTWSIRVISDSVGIDGHEVPIAFDEAGNLFAMWMHEGLPYMAISQDQGETFTEPVMMAPENVTITKWPTIAAGADGRAALAYYGTTAEGAQDDFGHDDTWNVYMTIVLNGTGDMLWETTTVNPLDDPVAREDCSGRCGGVGDFIDIEIDETGRPWAALVDTCVAECVTAADSDAYDARTFGFVGTLAEGPALRGPLAPLPPLLQPVTPTAIEVAQG